MGKGTNSYLDFAENDFKYFESSYNAGILGSPMAAMGQNICEKYLKHVIDEYAQPATDEEQRVKESILRTHSLRKLLRFLENEMDIDIPEDTEDALERIDGFYFSTRYPGEESFIPTTKDINKAYKAINYARELAYNIMGKFEKT